MNTLTTAQILQLRKWGFALATEVYWQFNKDFTTTLKESPLEDVLYELIKFAEAAVNELPLKTNLIIPKPYGIGLYKYNGKWSASLTPHSTVDSMNRTSAKDPDIYQAIYKLLKKVIDEIKKS